MQKIFKKFFNKINLQHSVNGRPIYMDYAATTPLDFRVLDSMLPYLTFNFGNPHSRSHLYGWETEKAVEQSREKIANVLNADKKEIIFTSGATESNNMVIKGIANFYGNKNKNHIITTQIDHKCVLDTCRYLETNGFKITYLKVDSKGRIDLNELYDSINSKTLLVSTIFINNETGIIQDIQKIGEICKEKKVFFHTDAAQAFGKVDIDVNKFNIHLLSISGHKIYGPKGVGALYIKRRPRVRLSPLINGGGQERGLRSGTLSPNLCVGLGKAAEIAFEEKQIDYKHIKELSDYFKKNLLKIPKIRFNSCFENGFPGIINVSFEYVEGESLLASIKTIAISSGSACTSASLEPSYVLRSMGLKEDIAHTSLRFGIGRFTTKKEIDYTLKLLEERVDILRQISPLWEDQLENINTNVDWVKTYK